jgi:DNA-binding transcriptional MerR regulator
VKPMMDELTLEELAQRSGLPLRTLRYYMQEGLLPGPDTHGKYARYSQQHLDRLEVIRRLKSLRLPLQEIHQIVNNMTLDEISQLRVYQDEIAGRFNQDLKLKLMKNLDKKDASSALDYIHSIQDGQMQLNSVIDSHNKQYSIKPLAMNSSHDQNQAAPASPRPFVSRESWRRIQVADGVELNVREPVNTYEEEKIGELIALANKLFEKKSGKQGRK